MCQPSSKETLHCDLQCFLLIRVKRVLTCPIEYVLTFFCMPAWQTCFIMFLLYMFFDQAPFLFLTMLQKGRKATQGVRINMFPI